MSQKTIFIIDDDPQIRRAYGIILRKAGGYAVQEFGMACDLLDAVAKGPEPDLILTDHDMPGMNGAELVTRLRSEGFTGPIIMSSASTRAKESEELMSLLDGFIPKPSPITDIIDSVHHALQG